MKQTATLLLSILVLTSSCVTKKVYQDLENKYADLKKEAQDKLDVVVNEKNKTSKVEQQ